MVLPKDVEKIAVSAFSGCVKLDYNTESDLNYLGSKENEYLYLVGVSSIEIESVTISKDCKFIAENAFDGCAKLTTIAVDEDNPNYKGIEGNLYSKDGKTLIKYAVGSTDDIEKKEISIATTVTTIGAGAFSGCTFISVKIPKSVTTIGANAFAGCENLETIYCYANNKPEGWHDNWNGGFNNVIFQYKDTETQGTAGLAFELMENGLEYQVVGYEGDEKNVVVPGIYQGKVVTKIADSAFKDKTLLEKITLTSRVNAIGDYAFSGCSSLKTISGNTAVTEIGAYAFSGTAFTTITISGRVVNIGEGAYSNCIKATKITISAGNFKVIAANTFSGCTALTSVSLGNYVTTIGDGAFSGCTSLESIVIPLKIKTMGSNIFEGCENITINCKARMAAAGWNSDWNGDCIVIWGYKG